jgi:site-specific DNA recombinase
MSATHQLRVAIYTRKSTEEGLEQEFNSLHAQREACEAYIASQRELGWKALPTRYDDGGLSGGSMERPALQRLLEDVEANRVDVIIVYKIDRLTRSLMDFARIVAVLDEHDVSFVSVTQQFNTATSMGRLKLNMLLSFAQFEREVTAERIRDKIAASKKKGMWMGGVVPLGFKVTDRKLIVNQAEAETIRWLYRTYLALGSVRRLKEEADRRSIVSKRRAGANPGGKPMTRGHLYHLLSNPLYAGKVRQQG